MDAPTFEFIGSRMKFATDLATDHDAFSAMAAYAQALHGRREQIALVEAIVRGLTPAACLIRDGWNKRGGRREEALWMRVAWVLRRVQQMEANR